LEFVMLLAEGSECGRVFSEGELQLLRLALVTGSVSLALVSMAWFGKLVLTWWGWRR
jgi:hypothetical protein